MGRFLCLFKILKKKTTSAFAAAFILKVTTGSDCYVLCSVP